MGSDEQEIVLLIYVIVDVIQNKVRIVMGGDGRCLRTPCAYVRAHGCLCVCVCVCPRPKDENPTKIPGCDRGGGVDGEKRVNPDVERALKIVGNLMHKKYAISFLFSVNIIRRSQCAIS